MHLILIRHSKTLQDPNIHPTEWGLSDEGVALADALSSDPLIQKLDVLYTSLQTKALETAVRLAKPNGIPVKTNNDFTEVTSFTKRLLGKEGYEKSAAQMYAGEIERLEDGESLQEALTRFTAAVELVVTTEAGKKAVGIVAHGNVLSLFSAQYGNESAYSIHNTIRMPDVAVLDWETKTFRSWWGTTALS